jgi:hypothetical protein
MAVVWGKGLKNRYVPIRKGIAQFSQSNSFPLILFFNNNDLSRLSFILFMFIFLLGNTLEVSIGQMTVFSIILSYQIHLNCISVVVILISKFKLR